MIVSTIRQFGLRLCADPEEIPFQHSSNIQMQFIKDENYNDYTVVGYYIPPGENEAKLLSINDDGTFTLGPDCFKQRGTLSFSFNLINSQEEIHLGSIDFEVRYSFGDGDTILPEPEEVWISLVTKVAKDAIKDDVAVVQQKAKEALQSASLANDKANEAQEYANNANQSANSASLSASSALTAKNDAIAASNSAIQAKQDAEQSANNAKNSANTALENANKSTEAIETVTQIKTEIENKANDFDANYQEKLKSFNDNATSKQNAFDNSVQTANTNFDNKVTQANSDLDAKVKEATKQAQKAKEEADRATQATDGKLDKNLGAENSDKVLITDAEGNIITQNKEDFEGGGTTNYNELENKPQINGIELSGNKSGNDIGLVNNQQGIENSGKVLGIGQDGLVVPVENAGASDNIIYKDVPKQLNPNITDGFKRAMWNLKMYGQSTQGADPSPTNKQDITAISSFFGSSSNSNFWQNPSPKILNGVTLTVDEDGWCTLNGLCTQSNLFSVKNITLTSGQYTLSIEKSGNYPSNAFALVQIYSSNGGGIVITNNQSNNYTVGFINDADNYEARIRIDEGFNYVNCKFRVVLNRGAEISPYTAPQSQPFLYTPTQEMYSTLDGSVSDFVDTQSGNEIYNMSGEVVFDGSDDEAWRLYAGQNGFYILLNDMMVGRGQQGFCDKFKVVSSASLTGIVLGQGNNYLYVTQVDTYATTIEEWKTWLSQNPITVVYPLATPIEIPIAPEQLQMLRSLYTYTGITNFLCNAPVSFTYERSLQIVINNLENAVNTNALNIAVKE